MANKNPSALLRQWQLGESALDLCLNRNGRWVAAMMQGGHVALAFSEDAGEEPQLVQIDDCEILSVIPDCDDHAYLVLTENGKIFITEPQIQVPTQIAQKDNISCIASSVAGHRVYSVGSTIFFLDELGEEKKETLSASDPIHDMQFNDDGTFLAVSHGQGITVFSDGKDDRDLNSDVPCSQIMWHGQDVAAVRDDETIAFWRAGQDHPTILQNDAYQTAPRLCGVVARDTYFAISGARLAVLLPMAENENSRRLGGADRRLVTFVTPHPYEPFVMIGYDDGMIVMASIDGRVPIMIHPPTAPSGAGVTGMVWNPHGDCLMATLESGWLMLFTETSIQKAVRARLQS